MFTKKLQASFYKRPSVIVAPKLLGKVLVHRTQDATYAGIIVEVEAYAGPDDAASHAYKGMRPRNTAMFEPGGCVYVYFTYGAHFCCNVVTGKKGSGEAVLVRALEPVQGIESMIVNRNIPESPKIQQQLCSGPGKLCQALQIDASLNGVSLLEDRMYITEGIRVKAEDIVSAPRVGITKAVELPWRFFIRNNVYVSKR